MPDDVSAARNGQPLYDCEGVTCDACSERGDCRMDAETSAYVCKTCDMKEDAAVRVGAAAAGVSVEQFQAGIDEYWRFRGTEW